jgi:hypothetical protein
MLLICALLKNRKKINIRAQKPEVNWVINSGKTTMTVKPQTRTFASQVPPTGVLDFVDLKEVERP